MAITECALYHDILKDEYHRTRNPRLSVQHYLSSRYKTGIDDPLQLQTILYPPPQVANYIRKALPPVPASCRASSRNPSKREPAPGIHVKMTFGVLSTGPKRFTLTDMKGTFVDAGTPAVLTQDMPEFTSNDVPIHSPQPQQSSNKINQLTVHPMNDDLNSSTLHHRRTPSNKIKQLTGYDLGINSRDAAYHQDAESDSDALDAGESRRTSSIYSREEEDHDYEEYNKKHRSFANDMPGLWQTWRPVSSESNKRASDNSNTSEDSELYSDESFVPTGLHVAPLTLRSRDVSQHAQNEGLASSEAREVNLSNSATDPTLRPSGESTRVASPRPYSATIDSFYSPDPSQFALNPRLAPTAPKTTQPQFVSSHFSDSDDSDSEGGYSMARGKDVVVHSLRSIPSHINFTTPTFRKTNKPASIRTMSSTASGQQKTPASALKSPYPFQNKSSIEEQSSDSSIPGSSEFNGPDAENTRFRRRFSSAFRSFSSKASTNTSNTSAPTSTATSPSTKTSISSSSSTLPRERIIYTTTRKPGTPDTPARPSFRGPYSSHKVRDMMKGKKSGAEEKKEEEERSEERRRRILNSIRVVRFGNEERGIEDVEEGSERVEEEVRGGGDDEGKALAWL